MHSVETVSNNKVKEIVKLHQKKYRDMTGLFIAEGGKALEDMMSAGIKLRDIIVLDGADISKISRPYKIANESIMKKISTTDGICEILTVGEKREYDIKDFIKYKRLLLLDSISDPGNLGTIIRSAAAFNFDGIILWGNCTDLYSSKVIRSSAGNFFKIPVIALRNKKEFDETFKNHTKISTSLYSKNTISIEECSQAERLILMMGSEAKGLDESLIKAADENIRLEMSKNVESLNLAVSCSIIMYQMFSQD